MSTRRLARDERGFVLSLVIFAVAALSIAATALFLVVQSESAMADSGAESSSAFHLAQAGLARYMGESFGRPARTTVYEMGGGTVTVTAERVVAALTPTEDVYLITSDAVLPDRRRPALASRRSVQQFAILNRQPFKVLAAITVATTDLHTRNVTLNGQDQAVSGECATAGATVAGIANVDEGDVRNTNITGSPTVLVQPWDVLMSGIGLDWSMVTDPAVPFDHDLPGAEWPRFGSLAADEYPSIRVDGDLRAFPWMSGRGLLVVTGEIRFYDGFSWDGAILAGSMNGNTTQSFTVNGSLITGFEGPTSNLLRFHGDASINFNSCNVLSAAEGIAMFSPLPNTWWERED